MNLNTCYFGDCRDTMRQLKADGVKVQTCVTSPPYYNLRDYGHAGQIGLEESPEQYITALVEVFRCVKDILSDDGTLWLNLGDSYYNYRPGKGQALSKQSIANNNQDLPQTCARRGNKLDGLKEKDLIGIPWMAAFALRADGWYLRQDIIWHKPNPMPESVTDRCTKSHEYIFMLSKSPKYYYDQDAIKTDAVNGDPTSPRGSKGVIGPLNSGNRKQDLTENRTYTGFNNRYEPVTKVNKRSVWTVTTKPYAEAHFAVFPSDLIEPCILAGAPVGGIVLDPFMGSGTTAQVAQNLGRQWIGCELNPEYFNLQQDRTAQSAFILESYK